MIATNHLPSLHFCISCSDPIQGGSIVSFDEAHFHLDCFSCSKCHQQMNGQSNVLLLTNGRPVCEDCSYVCKQCGLGIDQEAIMTGQESYHVNCFRCVSCNKCMDDLIYKQTNEGIYCMSCHNTSTEEKSHHSSGRNRPRHADRPLPAIPSMSNDDDAAVVPLLNSRVAIMEKSPKKAHSVSSSSSSLSSSSTSTSTEMQAASVLGIGTLQTSSPGTSPPTSTKRSKDPTPTSALTTSASPEPKTSNKLHQAKSVELNTSDIPSLNLSFFDNDSNELSNLTQSLGANLHSHSNSDRITITTATVKKMNRASELLRSSLEHLSSSSNDYNTANYTALPDNIDDLKQRLIQQTEQLTLSEANISTLKAASQKALDDLTTAKEEFKKEMETRQQHEYTILQLRHQLASLQQHQQLSASSSSSNGDNNGDITFSEQEIDRLTNTKVDLEKTCHQLKAYRDVLAAQSDDQAGLESSVLERYPMALQEHIQSLRKERDALQQEMEGLNKARDDVIHEMIVLNTKNAELSSMNNDLSRRMSEREREAAAIMAGTSFVHNTPSPSPSTEWLASPVSSPASPSFMMQRKSSDTSLLMQRITSQDSTASSSSNSKIFKMKKPKSNVFNKITSFGSSSGGGGGTQQQNSKKDAYTGPMSPSPYTLDQTQSLYNLNAAASSNDLLTSTSTGTGNSSSSNSRTGRYYRKDSKPSYDDTIALSSSNSNGTHAFLPSSFLRPVKCSACGDKIWGTTGYRCQGCGLICHSKCLVHLPVLCSTTSSSLELASPTESDSTKSVSMFGSSLASRVAFEERDVPFLVEQCIAAVETRGMDYEGIYRKSGGAAQMRTIQLAFESNDYLNLNNEDDINDICAVTSVLKQYFRELASPLLTFELYDPFMDAVRMLRGDAKIDKFIELISQLPKANYDTMKLLMVHLDNVRNRSDENLMTTKNLAMVFGPTLLRDKDATRDLLDMSYKNATIEFIINHTPLLFAD
ncbi:hypothetical protein BCR42DRAFT_364789 [Absidia repens]|uniref:RhoGAP-domain-containing protein n=1 Tax=Absidia repens TaxID=90262 RepID=A0A1X2J4I7_9FUNG|nr:hypothetical protein BCR42DRAFT_364789 [Absidia repens]